MPDQQETLADCYSARERSAMVWTQQLRQRCCEPLLRLLERVGVKPDYVTALSLSCGLLFCPAYRWSFAPLAFVLLALHVVLDGLDGPLARRLGTASRRGSFTDSTSDQIVVSASMLTLMAHDPPIVGSWPGGLYIFLYAMVVAFAMVRNAMGIPYSWVVRPRFFVYAWLLVETYLLPGSLSFVVWLFNAILGWKMFTGFHAIRRDL